MRMLILAHRAFCVDMEPQIKRQEVDKVLEF